MLKYFLEMVSLLLISFQVLCDICGQILDLCGVTTQFPWRTTAATTTVVTNGNTNTTKLKELCKNLLVSWS